MRGLLYIDNDDVQQVVRRAPVLPMVPLDTFEGVWADTIADSPQVAKVTVTDGLRH